MILDYSVMIYVCRIVFTACGDARARATGRPTSAEPQSDSGSRACLVGQRASRPRTPGQRTVYRVPDPRSALCSPS